MTRIVIDNKVFCKRCGKWKKFVEFPRDKHKRLGIITAYCNECNAIRNKALYQKKPEIFKKSSGKWSQNNLQKRFAYRCVQNAIRTGKLKKPNKCQKCGKFKKLDAHHWHGYENDFILDVQWLCRPCHKRID